MALFQAYAEGGDPDRVWERLCDWEATSEWMSPPTTVTVVGERRAGIGTRLYAVSTMLGFIRLKDHMVVTDWIDGREIRVRHVGWMVRGDGIFRVSPEGRFIWIEDMPLPLGVVGELLGFLARPVVQWFIRRSCERLIRSSQ